MIRMNATSRSVVLLAALCAMAACAPRVTVSVRPAIGTVYAHKEAGLTPAEKAHRDNHCGEMGCPVLAAGVSFGPTAKIYRAGYVLEHSSVDKISLWVAEKVTAVQIEGSLARDDKFRPDPLLKPAARAELADYKKSGYDRGHQAPAANQMKDEALKSETFFLSNMAPQVPAMNQQIWRELENLTRDWVKRFGTAWEITGPMFYEAEEDDPNTADGTVTAKRIGPGQVAVPTHFYKIVIVKEGTQFRAIAFVMENKKFTRPFHFENFIQAISWIEKRTGLDFLPDLSLQEQRRLEKDPSPMWPN